MLIQGNGKPFSIIYKLKQADVPVQHAFADEHEQTLYIACENKKRHELIRFSFEELGL